MHLLITYAYLCNTKCCKQAVSQQWLWAALFESCYDVVPDQRYQGVFLFGFRKLASHRSSHIIRYVNDFASIGVVTLSVCRTGLLEPALHGWKLLLQLQGLACKDQAPGMHLCGC
jgi:hypothetical protein